jgi:NADH-quinone oxidoreductase subunit N
VLYLLVYAFMTIGAFAVVTIIGRSTHDARHTLSEYRGLAARRPVLAGLLTLFLLAQAGVPATGGFVAKLQVFAAAVDARLYYLAIAGVLASVVSAFFYLRIVVTMYTGGDEAEPAPRPAPRVDAPAAVVLAVTAALTLVIGILPGAFLDVAKDATFLLR